jgi:hypothetical protein
LAAFWRYNTLVSVTVTVTATATLDVIVTVLPNLKSPG